MTDIFVTLEWLAENRSNVSVVDVRDEWSYRAGHIPGATNIPFRKFRGPSDETEGKLPTSERFASLLEKAGIGPSDRILAYDGEFGVFASRFLATAVVYGHPLIQLQLLDGDYVAWQRRWTSSTVDSTIEPASYHCERIDDDPLITAEELEVALGTEAVIVDTRDPVEFDTVHLPGAINFQWRDLVDEERRRLLPPAQRVEALTTHGIELDRPVRLYCNTARRLSFVFAVLREWGHEDIAFYEGGIDTWAKYGGPVETTS